MSQSSKLLSNAANSSIPSSSPVASNTASFSKSMDDINGTTIFEYFPLSSSTKTIQLSDTLITKSSSPSQFTVFSASMSQTTIPSTITMTMTDQSKGIVQTMQSSSSGIATSTFIKAATLKNTNKLINEVSSDDEAPNSRSTSIDTASSTPISTSSSILTAATTSEASITEGVTIRRTRRFKVGWEGILGESSNASHINYQWNLLLFIGLFFATFFIIFE